MKGCWFSQLFCSAWSKKKRSLIGSNGVFFFFDLKGTRRYSQHTIRQVYLRTLLNVHKSLPYAPVKLTRSKAFVIQIWVCGGTAAILKKKKKTEATTAITIESTNTCVEPGLQQRPVRSLTPLFSISYKNKSRNASEEKKKTAFSHSHFSQQQRKKKKI